MAGNGLLAGLVAITAPSGFVNTVGAGDHWIYRRDADLPQRRVRRARTQGRRSRRSDLGARRLWGLWGVLSVGLFADGTSNYGGSWNGVDGSVRGLFYGDPSQFVAQIIGCATLVGIVFTISYLGNWLIDGLVGQRVGAASELEGLDLPEMGALGYP